MSKTLIALLMSLAVVVPTTALHEAAAGPSESAVSSVSSGGWTSVATVKASFRAAWNQSSYSERKSVCDMWNVSKRLAVSTATGYLTREGWYPRSNIKKGVRKVMRQKCRWF